MPAELVLMTRTLTAVEFGQLAAVPVWSKNSCGLALVVFQEAPEPFSTVNRTWTPFVCS
jgi:hypothetical protein